ncbi:VOC family protein [Agromyces atrinae]|uniref:VOC family protein n=1 Tax=Agromyces atrinae TaxID=592376 RepID=UPI001F56656C|nr:VOC family protein [Agromyces atrinae]MCI2958665.1 VOC family protein [Agromyces atrinae]
MAVRRMDHVGFVVDDLESAVAFFVALGLEVEGRASVSGEWADRLLALDDVRTDIAVVRTPDGQSRVELSTFRNPAVKPGMPDAPVNVTGIPRLTFVVDSLDETLEDLNLHGGRLVGDIARYEDVCRYCYVRGPAGVIIGIVEEF